MLDLDSAWEAFHQWREDEGARLIPPHRRIEVFEASNWRCCYCGVTLAYPDYRAGFKCDGFATVEHIRRRADGGSNERDNLAAACAWCNNSRQDFDALDWFWRVQELVAAGDHPAFQVGKTLA